MNSAHLLTETTNTNSTRASGPPELMNAVFRVLHWPVIEVK